MEERCPAVVLAVGATALVSVAKVVSAAEKIREMMSQERAAFLAAVRLAVESPPTVRLAAESLPAVRLEAVAVRVGTGFPVSP